MKNSTKFWLGLFSIFLIIITCIYPCILGPIAAIVFIILPILYVIMSLIFYDSDESYYNYEWHIFGKYNFRVLIARFNTWLDNLEFNKNDQREYIQLGTKGNRQL